MIVKDMMVVSLVISAIGGAIFIFLLAKTLWEWRKATTPTEMAILVYKLFGDQSAREEGMRLGQINILAGGRFGLMIATLMVALAFGLGAFLFRILVIVGGVHGYL